MSLHFRLSQIHITLITVVSKNMLGIIMVIVFLLLLSLSFKIHSTLVYFGIIPEFGDKVMSSFLLVFQNSVF